jgi:lysophospholipase L1-like esterase
MRPTLLFFGDSITYRNRWEMMLGRDDILNLGIDSNTTHDMLFRLENISLEHFKTVSLMAGINDIAMGENVSEIFERYGVIIEHFMAFGLRIIVTSTLHVTSDCFESTSINDQVDLLNLRLKRLCHEDGLEYCDLNTQLSQNGALQSHYSVDGIHLSQAAYRVWAEMLSKIV